MRPLRLSMRAFGPFAGEESVDFTALGDASLVLIHGPTGAGKTTVLDAICYALFGESSGQERQGQQMRSHHADPETLTEVTFEFRFRGEVYRAWRRPSQARPRKRGEGMTEEPHAAHLHRLVEPDGRWEPLATQPTKVKEAVEELLGLTAKQFRQVVVLPQGRFREVLTADSKSREEVFARLFGTELYERVTEALKRREASLRRQVEDVQLEQRTRLQPFGVTDLEALSELTKARALEAERAAAVEAAAKRAAQGAREALQRAQRDRQKLDERAAAEAEHQALKAAGEKVARVRARLAAARAAEPVRAWRETFRDAQQAHAEAERALREAARAAEEATERYARAKEALDAERERGEERADAERRLETLLDPQGTAAQLWRAKAEQSEKKIALDHATKAERDAREALQHRRRALTAAEEAAREQAALAAQVEALEAQLDRARRREEAARELAESEQALIDAEAELADAERAAQRAREERDARARAEEALLRRWREGQAAALARELVEGAPCPVCGATEHPRPATGDDGAVSDAELAAARAERERAEGAHTEAEATLASRRQALEGQRAKVAEARARLAQLPAEEAAADLDSLERALHEAREARDAQAARDAELTAARRAVADAEAELERRAQAAREAESKVAQIDERVEGLRRQVPEELQDPTALKAARARLEAQVRTLREALERAEAAERSARDERTRAETRVAEARSALARAEENLARSRAQLDRARREAGFEDDASLERALADVPRLAELDARAHAHDEQLAVATARLERARRDAEGLAEPDLAAAEEAAATAERAYEEAISNLAQARQAAQTCRAALAELTERAEEVARLEQLQRRAAHLAQVASGRGRNQLNLSFQRYVLAVLLDEVLDAATRRLHVMSRGRYELQRVEGVTRRNRAGGLELDVFDAHTGRTRPVSTLSGGEGFLAALALSLGLVDVVQAHAGGVELDALFIDEGFGSLDEQSLRDAIDVLTELNQAKRLVGIISHVPELRERIDARLEVRPTERGSTTRLHVP